jgi:hypothetical protein
VPTFRLYRDDRGPVVTLIDPGVEPKHVDQPDAEALIREARRLRRRRWAIGLLLVAVLIGTGVAWAVSGGPGGPSTSGARAGRGRVTVRDLPEGPFANLDVAGPLAVSPIGALYVADVRTERVLVRLSNGRFRVVAGNGKKGLTGDGGAAVDAAFVDISDLAVAPNGSLYIVDGRRIRVVNQNGVISTVAGVPGVFDQQIGTHPTPITNGTPARSVSIRQLNWSSIALSMEGQLYISTGVQLLRLHDGELDVIRTRAVDPPYDGRPLDNLGQIAVDAHGNVDVSGGNGWSLWQVAPDGRATVITNSGARRSGGNTSVLERAPDGVVYGEDGSTLLRIQASRAVPAYTFPNKERPGFWLTYFAVGVGGTIYADEIPGGGAFEQYQQLRALRRSYSSVLWQQTPADVARA